MVIQYFLMHAIILYMSANLSKSYGGFVQSWLEERFLIKVSSQYLHISLYDVFRFCKMLMAWQSQCDGRVVWQCGRIYHQVADDAVCRSGKYQIQYVAMDVRCVSYMLIQILWKEMLLEVHSFLFCCILKVIIDISNHYKTASSCWQSTLQTHPVTHWLAGHVC